MISHKDLNHWSWDEVVKTVTSTTCRPLISGCWSKAFLLPAVHL